MNLTSILFNSKSARLIKREGNISAPVQVIERNDLPDEQKTHWDITVAALNGLLATGEKVISTEIDPAPPAAIAFETVEEVIDGETVQHQNPTAWRDTLNAYIQIKMVNGGSRRVALNSEQFSVTVARDALLELWIFFSHIV